MPGDRWGETATSPFRYLSVVLAATAVLAMLFALTPATAPGLALLDLAVAVALLILAALTRWVAPLVPGRWAIDAVLVLVTVMACGGALVVPEAVAQVLVGLGLVMVAVFAAYFLPPRRYVGQLILLVVGYTVAVVANPRFRSLMVPVAVLSVVVGVSAMIAVLAARVRSLVLEDPLTGVLNRRGMAVLAPRIAATAARTGQPVVVGLIDIDGFKAFNDAHGHVAGDRLLVAVAEAWRAGLRTGDLLVRYGGDEFAVVLVGLDVGQGDEVAERIRTTGPPDWSAGFSEWCAEESFEDALTRADAAMFRVKRDRRYGAPPE